jgi:hypothetical protein
MHMSDDKRFTLSEAELEFAKKINGRVWELLEKPDRSRVEDWEMLHASHASLYHWLQVGTGLHHQRGEWLVSRVQTVLGNGDEVIQYSNRCLELTKDYSDLMEDFDFAFAYEAAARANVLAGNIEEAKKFIGLARSAGEAIKNDEDRTIFLKEFEGGEWYDLL